MLDRFCTPAHAGPWKGRGTASKWPIVCPADTFHYPRLAHWFMGLNFALALFFFGLVCLPVPAVPFCSEVYVVAYWVYMFWNKSSTYIAFFCIIFQHWLILQQAWNVGESDSCFDFPFSAMWRTKLKFSYFISENYLHFCEVIPLECFL